MKESQKAEKPQVIKQDLLVSKSEWQEYRQVQKLGTFNMLDPNARMLTSLNREQWFHILKNYQYFVNLYGSEC